MSQFCTGVLSPLYIVKMDSRPTKNYECHYASDKKCSDFSLKMHQKRLTAGLRPDPLGELTALSAPHSPSWI